MIMNNQEEQKLLEGSGQPADAGTPPKKEKEQASHTFKFVPPPVAPIRRVGTLTMGLSLIVAGVVALICTFIPSFPLVTALKFAPLIFVFIGIEVLIAYFFHKGERIRYDFLSTIVCFLLICGCVALSAVPLAWQYIGPEALNVRESLEDEVENHIYDAVQSSVKISSARINAYLPHVIPIDQNTDYNELLDKTNVYVSFSLSGPYTSKEAFAKDCRKILDKLSTLPFHYQNIFFAHNTNKFALELYIEGVFAQNQDVEQLIQGVTINHFEYAENEMYGYEEEPDDFPEYASVTKEPMSEKMAVVEQNLE